MFFLLALAHAVFCAVAARIIWQSVRRDGITALNFTAASFFAISSFGLIFSHFVDYGIALPFSDDSGMVVYKKLDEVFFRQVVSHWILLTTLCVALIRKRSKVRINVRTLQPLPPAVWRFVLGALFILAYYKYFIAGPGLQTLIDTRLTYLSAEDAVVARSLAKDNLYGQGAYLASVAAYILLPIFFATYATSTRTRSSGAVFWLAWLTCTTLSLAYAYQTRQKAPIISVLLIYTLLGRTRSQAEDADIREVRLWRYAWAGAGLFALSVLLYVLVFNMDVGDSIYATFVRALMVPSATEANYFYAFPKIFPFRGLAESFVIRIFLQPGQTGVSIYDVAVAATGIQFTANASFLAVAWSGLGYAGVAIVSLALWMSLAVVDGLIAAHPKKMRFAFLAVMTPAILILNSGSFVEFIGAGGLLSPLLLSFITGRKGTRTPTPLTPSRS